MDRGQELNLQTFFSLLNLPDVRIDTRMSFDEPPFFLHIEVGARLVMCLGLAMPRHMANDALRNALKQVCPQRLRGMPVRVYPLGERLMWSTALAPASSGQEIHAAYRILRGLADAAVPGRS